MMRQLALVAALLGGAATAASATCSQVHQLLAQGFSESEIASGLAVPIGAVQSCSRSVPISPAGPPPFGAAGPAPFGAAGKAPIGAAGKAPFGAAGPAPIGAAGPAPIGAAGPAPFGSARQVTKPVTK
jgi:hypothetical protein